MEWIDSKIIYGHSAKHELKKVAEGLYKCEDSQYCRLIGYPENIQAIDFDGGPMLTINQEIGNIGIIDRIYDNGIIEFKKVTNNNGTIDN